MKKKQLKKIITLVIIIFLIIASIILIKLFTKNASKNNKLDDNNEIFSKITSDGTRINISEKLNADKKIDELDITNIELKSDGQVTQLTALIKNNTGKVKGDYTAKVIFVDSNNTKIADEIK